LGDYPPFDTTLSGWFNVSFVDTEQPITFTSYYASAIPRAFWAGWDWAVAQGLYLTLLLGVGAVVCATLYAVIRAMRRSHSWADAWNHVGQSIRDFFIAGVGAVVFMLLFMLVVSFVQDAPVQLQKAREKIAGWHKAWEKQAAEDRSQIKSLEAKIAKASQANFHFCTRI
jgi:hypothetical protein